MAWLHLLPCAEQVYNMAVYSPARYSSVAVVCTDAPQGDPALDLVVGSESRLEAPARFTEQLAPVRECRRKAQECHARNYDKRHSAFTFDSGDVVFADSHAI